MGKLLLVSHMISFVHISPLYMKTKYLLILVEFSYFHVLFILAMFGLGKKEKTNETVSCITHDSYFYNTII